MANNKKRSYRNKNYSNQERIKLLQENEKNYTTTTFAKAKDVLQQVDLAQPKTITYNVFSKESLRQYMKNPASESNQKSLRKLSNFLYSVSHVYRRLINFKALQITLRAWQAYPEIDNPNEIDKELISENYYKVINYVNRMQLPSQALKLTLNMWLNDVCYIFTYGDPSNKEGFFIHILDPDYCKISGQDFYSGVLHIAFDFSFFDANPFYLDVYDPVFKKMYNKYKADSSLKWQELPCERSTAFKININNLDYPLPPLSGLFEPIIDLSDLQGIQNVKDEMEIFKLLVAKIGYLKGANSPDEFEISLDLAKTFYDKMKDVMPANVAMMLSPMSIDSVDFQSNTANDSNIISEAYSNVVDSYGGIVLNSNRITNSTAFKMALMFDTMDAMAPVEQFQSWVNFYVLKNLGETNIMVNFDKTSPYFLNDRIDQLSKICMYSVPAKMELYSLIGGSPVKERGMGVLEDILGITKTTWSSPLISSNTMSVSSDDINGNEKTDDELSDEGVRTRDSDKNDN